MSTGYISPIAHGYRSQTYRVGAGSESVPSFAGIADQDTGIYWPDTNDLAIVTGGVKHVTFTEEGDLVLHNEEFGFIGGAFGTVFRNNDDDADNLYIADDGHVLIRNGLTVIDGGIAVTGSVALPTGAITSAMILDGTIVNADISASAAIAASKLADYADTTWTPTVAGDGTAGANTYSLQQGNYMRIGNLVIATFMITMTAKDGAMAGNIYVSLPVAVRNTSNLLFSASLRASDITLTGGYSWLTITPVANTSRAFIQQSGSGVALANIVAASIAATTAIVGTVVYFA